MSATSHGAAAGAVLGIVAVLLAQQLGLWSLSDLGTSVVYLVLGIVVGAAVCGAIGMALGRRWVATHPTEPPAGH